MSILTAPKTVGTRTRETAERTITYCDAVREAADQEMERDPSVLVFGLDVDDPKAIQGTTRGLLEKYGPGSVFGTPLSEDAMTGAAIGMALAGLRPIHVHIRMDFLMLAMNQLVNVAAKTRYMYGGQLPCAARSPLHDRQELGPGAQHSQGLYSFFMHVPGLKVAAPSTPYDAKGCLIAAVRDDNPVLVCRASDAPLPERAGARRVVHRRAGQSPRHGRRRGCDARRRLLHAGRMSACLSLSPVDRHPCRSHRSDLAGAARHRHDRHLRSQDRQVDRGRQWLDQLRRRGRDRGPGCWSGSRANARFGSSAWASRRPPVRRRRRLKISIIRIRAPLPPPPATWSRERRPVGCLPKINLSTHSYSRGHSDAPGT